MHDDPLRALPAVSEILAVATVARFLETSGRSTVVDAVRDSLQAMRTQIIEGLMDADRRHLIDRIAADTAQRLQAMGLQRLSPVINATGIILHTSLGRAPLAPAAITAVTESAAYCNLEVDLPSGDRRPRGYQMAADWHRLTGAEAALVVNNNAAATLLTLQALCRGREVIISRGQLIEIGGSFRLPEIFSLSGSTLREVGTTNRTHLADYATAIGPQTAAILRVHPSNYRIVGFTETPEIDSLAQLGHAHGLLVIDDIGSGCLVDLTRYGLPAEPTFGASLQAGADIVLGSGDKLLGGPQCGIILGKQPLVQQIQNHPLARAVRIDKLTLAALSATLDLYSRGVAEQNVPVLQMLSVSIETLQQRAQAIVSALSSSPLDCEVSIGVSEVGGGSLPAVELPTAVVRIKHGSISTEVLTARLRTGEPHVFGRINADAVLLDLRSVPAADDVRLIEALRRI
ncbi:MAG: L-seryl-tRNA(Sec) selenium transferase [Planctomycetaceae bacterium]|nr:L-seryl-tRNA(Sec) selenium transferase [Planctomycetaceae bacterium]